MLVSVPSTKPIAGSLRFEPALGVAASDARLPHLHLGHAPLPQPLRGSVMLLGNFDGLHLGHQALLHRAKTCAAREGRSLSIMACEPHPKQLFAPDLAPFRLSCGMARYGRLAEEGLHTVWTPRFDRAFAGLSAQAFVERFLVAEFAVSRVVVGQDFRFGAGRQGDVDLLERSGRHWGYLLDVVEDVSEGGVRVSSSLVRQLIAAGQVPQAVALLGQPWVVPVACVGAGRYQANPAQLLPPAGIYSVQAKSRRAAGLGQVTVEITKDRRITGYLPPQTAAISWGASARL
ncbi:hypothetical protein [Thioclava sp. GXIMD2076]|uniref:hypothetical protein n=1 Tax=Thioclava sp. GXIMD2076 TaxID=3131931 RepID=UPI0030D328B6